MFGYDQLSTVSAGGVTNTYGYDEQKRLSGIEHNGISYGFAYDVWGNTVSTSVAGETLVEHTYEARNGRLTETTYANGFRVEPMYNEREQVIGSKRNGTVVEEILYNNMGQVVKYVDFANDLCYTYDYDTMGRVLREQRTEQASGNKVAELRYEYDSQGRLTRLVYDDGTGAQSYG